MSNVPANRGKQNPAYIKRVEEIRSIVHRMDENQAWDSIQARDLDPAIVDFVAEQLQEHSAGEVAKMLGLTAGRNSKQWKKIQAYFRQGFRADAEAYLYQQTHKYFKVIEKAKEVLEDAFENGTPHVTANQQGDVTITRVKGATKELGSFLESYSKSIALPVKLWKEFGAIGEKKDIQQGGITIVVKTNVPSPSQADVDAYRNRITKMDKPVIDVTNESKDGE